MSRIYPAQLHPHPHPGRSRESCPDCGFIIDDKMSVLTEGFDCPRCKAHYSETEFYEEQVGKEIIRRAGWKKKGKERN